MATRLATRRPCAQRQGHRAGAPRTPRPRFSRVSAPHPASRQLGRSASRPGAVRRIRWRSSGRLRRHRRMIDASAAGPSAASVPAGRAGSPSSTRMASARERQLASHHLVEQDRRPTRGPIACLRADRADLRRHVAEVPPGCRHSETSGPGGLVGPIHPTRRARPKSRSFTSPAGVIMTLALFRSRCTTPWPCACASASVIWIAQRMASPPAGPLWHQVTRVGRRRTPSRCRGGYRPDRRGGSCRCADG